MRFAPIASVPKSRMAVASLVLLSLVATSGCGWFRKTNDLYAQSPESRPLEVPPDLDRPRGDTVPGTPASASAASPRPAAAAPIGFTTTGTRDEVFGKVEAALAAIDGVQVTSRAIGLGVFDVNYQGSNFLVRLGEVGSAIQVSAVDPRGLPASGDAPTQLIKALETAIAGG